MQIGFRARICSSCRFYNAARSRHMQAGATLETLPSTTHFLGTMKTLKRGPARA